MSKHLVSLPLTFKMIVMTTNHPEHLDPALIRPGRIDKIVELTYMTEEDAAEMLEHYFAAKMEESERLELGRIFSSGITITPAMMERHVLELGTIQEVLDTIGKQKRRRLCSPENEEKDTE